MRVNPLRILARPYPIFLDLKENLNDGKQRIYF
mgnify:CR=1 FL=1